MKKEDTPISHDGHRERLTNLVYDAGLDNVSKVQAIEMFLTYIFPRGDVNPLAHKLLEKYDTFGDIIDADINDLMMLKGLNERSSKKIAIFKDLVFYYASSKMNQQVNLKNEGEFIDLCEQLLRFKNTENLYIFAFAHNMKLIQKRCYDLKQIRQVGINPLELYSFISSTHPAYLLIAHNHPNGTAMSSPDDQDAYVFIEELIKNLEVKLLDSLVVGNDGIYSEVQKGFVRHFDTSGKLLSIKQN